MCRCTVCAHHIMKAFLLASAMARMLEGCYVSHTETHEQAGYTCFPVNIWLNLWRGHARHICNNCCYTKTWFLQWNKGYKKSMRVVKIAIHEVAASVIIQGLCWNVHIKHDLTLSDHAKSCLHSHTQKGTSSYGSQLDHSCHTQWSICRAQPVEAPLLLYLASWIPHVVGNHTVCMFPAQQMQYGNVAVTLLCHASPTNDVLVQQLVCWVT